MCTATTESIETLVSLYCGNSDARTKHIFREHLQVLVEISKAEQRMELDIDTHFDRGVRGIVH